MCSKMMQQLQRKDSIEKAESRGRFTSDVKFQLFKSDFFAPKLTNTTSSPKYWSTVKILQIPSKCIYDIVEIYFQSSQNVNICDFVSNAHLTSNSGYIGLQLDLWANTDRTFCKTFCLGSMSQIGLDIKYRWTFFLHHHTCDEMKISKTMLVI